MSADQSQTVQGLSASIFYRDPRAALDWLEKAFGFELKFLVLDDADNLGHSTMAFGNSEFSVNGEWEAPAIVGPARMRSPLTIEGVNTQFMRVHLTEGLEAHCERARAAGAVITDEPQDQFYGSRTYRALDLEGHLWTFDMPVAHVSAEAIEAGKIWTIRQAVRKSED